MARRVPPPGAPARREAHEEGSEPENLAGANVTGFSLLLWLESVRGSRCEWGACVGRTAFGDKARER